MSKPSSCNDISLRRRLRGLRQALDFGKSYPITQGVGIKAPEILEVVMANVVPVMLCADCAKRRK